MERKGTPKESTKTAEVRVFSVIVTISRHTHFLRWYFGLAVYITSHVRQNTLETNFEHEI